MRVDEQAMGRLIEESQDLQSEVRPAAMEATAALAELHHERGEVRPEPAELEAFTRSRRSLLARLSAMGGGMVLGGGAIGAAVSALLAQPASAETSLDVQMLQTASSLERLAVATYGAALTLPFIKDGNKVIVAFATTTMSQHDEHKKAFQAQTSALGGTPQDTPNPKYAPVVEAAKPNLKTPLDVVTLAATLETVARDTYLVDLAMYTDIKSRMLMASVMGVETQHLA